MATQEEMAKWQAELDHATKNNWNDDRGYFTDRRNWIAKGMAESGDYAGQQQYIGDELERATAAGWNDDRGYFTNLRNMQSQGQEAAKMAAQKEQIPYRHGQVHQDPNMAGGYVAPTQTFSPHTGSKKRDGVSQGTGGGIADALRNPATIPVNERIAARPDLQGGGYKPAQYATTPAPRRVTPITNQGRATALRSGA